MSDEASTEVRKQRKTEQMIFRATPDERRALKGYADKRGVSMARVLRKIVRELVSDDTVDLFEDDMAGLVAVRRQLSAIGRNVNQVARKINQGDLPASPADALGIEQLRGELKGVLAEIDRIRDDANKRRVIMRKRTRKGFAE